MRSSVFLLCIAVITCWIMAADVVALDKTAAVIVLDAIPELDGPIPLTVDINLADLSEALGLADPIVPDRARAVYEGSANRRIAIPCQVDSDPVSGKHGRGQLSVLLPPKAKGEGSVKVYFERESPSTEFEFRAGSIRLTRDGEAIVVSNSHYTVRHDASKMGGLPSCIEFRKTGKVFDSFMLNDRVYDATSKTGYFLRFDRRPEIKVIGSGPARVCVRVRARYVSNSGEVPDSMPEATYVFCYYPDLPFVRMHVEVKQRDVRAWNELHVMEINFPGKAFTHWLGSGTESPQKFSADKTSRRPRGWGAIVEGKSVIGMMPLGQSCIIYDGRGGYGTYLHGPWVKWSGNAQTFDVLLWVGSSENPVRAGTELSELSRARGVELTTEHLLRMRKKLDRAVVGIASVPLRSRAAQVVRLARIPMSGRGLADRTRAADALAQVLARGRLYRRQLLDAAGLPGVALVGEGRLSIALQRRADGVRLLSAFDGQALTELVDPGKNGFWSVRVKHADGSVFDLDSSEGWRAVNWDLGKHKVGITWEKPDAAPGAAIRVRCALEVEEARSSWKLAIDNSSDLFSVREITFPNWCLCAIGDSPGDDSIVTPYGSGRLLRAPLRDGVQFEGLYPSGWRSMQFFAHYDRQCGVYVAWHDPVASTKRLFAKCQTGANAIAVGAAWPAPDCGVPGNDWKSPGPCVLQVFDGDWFDAAQIYKEWVRREARWWPCRGTAGRPDTPKWMRQICVWAQTGGGPERVVKPVIKFAQFMGVPTALHWYNWHQIPFDNDYPHYFPTKPGVAKGVRELQKAGVRVMPYINARLWDTRDRGGEDFEFTRVARSAASKNEQGEPYTETYSSKEKDGSRVRLAAMCPATELWRNRVSDIVLRLVGPEVGMDGVYLDQVAAARPRLCYDRSHGHSLGGGHWWTTQGYWPMLERLRKTLEERYPGEKMLTTECNAEPYTHVFDGYLTWHFQYQDQIPLFAAVYGGKIVMFSRAYSGTSRKGVAMRAKTAQAFVFGEQLGWISPAVVDDPVAGPFMRQLARLRYALLDYMAEGEMARPPVVSGDIPDVTADWCWQGRGNVTVSALQRGAWRAKDGRVVLLLVNVMDKDLHCTLRFNGSAYGFAGLKPLVLTTRTVEGTGMPQEREDVFHESLVMPALKALALEVAARGGAR